MPLMTGSSKAVISGNIHEMKKAGYSQPVAVAASLNAAGKSTKKKRLKMRMKKKKAE